MTNNTEEHCAASAEYIDNNTCNSCSSIMVYTITDKADETNGTTKTINLSIIPGEEKVGFSKNAKNIFRSLPFPRKGRDWNRGMFHFATNPKG